MLTTFTTEQLASLVDEAHAAILTANGAQPYDSAVYEETRRVFEAAVMVYAQGSKTYAAGLIELIDDSGESVSYYVRTMSRADILRYGR